MAAPSRAPEAAREGKKASPADNPERFTIDFRMKEVSVAIQIKNFLYIFQTYSKHFSESKKAKDLTGNYFSPDAIIQAGPFAFKINVAWSLGRDKSLMAHSMLGVVVERVDDHLDTCITTIQIKLINAIPAHSIWKSDGPSSIAYRTTRGWFPLPCAERREPHDGFVLLKEALDPSKGWLDMGTLSVECTMKVKVSDPECMRDPESTDSQTLQDLSAQWSQMLASGRHSDVLVKVGEEEIPAHKAVLAARSPVFDAMWTHGLSEQEKKEVVITDLEPSSVKQLMLFMYTGKLEADRVLANDEATVNLLEAAHRYQVDVLVDICVQALSCGLTQDIVAARLMLADHLGIETLRERCLSYIASSSETTRAVQGSDGFMELASKRPHLMKDILEALVPPAKSARTR